MKNRTRSIPAAVLSCLVLTSCARKSADQDPSDCIPTETSSGSVLAFASTRMEIVHPATPGYPAAAMEAADVTGDGVVDVALLRSSIDPDGSDTAFLSIHAGRGEGRIDPTPAVEREISGTANDLEFEDMDGDGVADLVVSIGGNPEISPPDPGRVVIYFLGLTGGACAVTRETILLAGFDPVQVVAADVTADAVPDLIVSGSRDTAILLGIGRGSYSDPQWLGIACRPFIGDLNLDGRAEILLATIPRSSEVLIADCTSRSGPSLSCLLRSPDNNTFTSFDVADFDGDGLPDVAAGMREADGSNNGVIRLWYGDGRLGFPRSLDLPTGAIHHLAGGDFNGDGRRDVACAVETADFLLTVFLGDAGGGFSGSSASVQNYGIEDLRSADLNGDSRSDLLVSSGWAMAFFGETGMLSKAPRTAVSGTGMLHLADVNGDGRADLVRAGDAIVWRPSLGDGTFGPERTLPGFVPVRRACSSDTDDDGFEDLLVESWGRIWLLRGSADGLLPAVQIASGMALVLIDVDGDGRTESVTLDPVGGGLTVSACSGTSSDLRASTAWRETVQIPFDIDVDGYTDVARLDDDADRLSLFRNRGDGTFERVQDVSLPGAPYFLVSGDGNADGRRDLYLVHRGDPRLSRRMDGGAGTSGSLADSPLDFEVGSAADVDGDGTLDLVGIAGDMICALSVACGDGATIRPTEAALGGTRIFGLCLGDIDGNGVLDVVHSDERSFDGSVAVHRLQIASSGSSESPVCDDGAEERKVRRWIRSGLVRKVIEELRKRHGEQGWTRLAAAHGNPSQAAAWVRNLLRSESDPSRALQRILDEADRFLNPAPSPIARKSASRKK